VNIAKFLFTDVSPDDWYYDAMCYVVDRGLFNGVSTTSFAPKQTMTRSMLVNVLYRMEGSPEILYLPLFSDVPEDAWFVPGVIWSAIMQIAVGIEGEKFFPNEPVTRQEMAMMLYNYAKWLGCDTSKRGDLSTFADGDTVPEAAAEAFSWAVGVGLFQGDTANNLSPEAVSNRAQVATLLQRFELWLGR